MTYSLYFVENTYKFQERAHTKIRFTGIEITLTQNIVFDSKKKKIKIRILVPKPVLLGSYFAVPAFYSLTDLPIRTMALFIRLYDTQQITGLRFHKLYLDLKQSTVLHLFIIIQLSRCV